MLDDKALFDHAAEFAAFHFNEKGELAPMWLLDNGKDHIYCVLTPFTGDDSKDNAVKVIKEIIKEKGIVRAAFMAEAWEVVVRKGQPEYDHPEDFRPSEHEDRREIIQLSVESKDGIMMGGYYILRPEHGKATLSPLKCEEMTNDYGGKFSGLFTS